jgi:hypothetical protein
MRHITVGNGQQLEDIALLAYGDVAMGSMLLMIDNNLSPNTVLFGGQVLKARLSAAGLPDNSSSIKQLLAAENIDPNSNIFGEVDQQLYVDEDYVDEDYVD